MANYNQHNLVLTSDYLTLAEYGANTFTVNQPAGDAQQQQTWYYNFTVPNNDEKGVMDYFQITKDGVTTIGSYLSYTYGSENMALRVYRTSETNIRAEFSVPKRVTSSQPFPAQTFKIQVWSYKNPRSL